jgi:hypothetical protein
MGPQDKTRDLTPEDFDLDFWIKFMAHIPKSYGCWEWQGACNNKGYGVIRHRQSKGAILAHRAAFVMAKGPTRRKLNVIHSCDNPCCVNPAHLSLATTAENMADKVQKGRHSRGKEHGRAILAGIRAAQARGVRFGAKNPVKGMSHPTAKLTDAQVIEIRSRAATEKVSRRQMAREYGITVSIVSGIVRGERWRHLLPSSGVR